MLGKMFVLIVAAALLPQPGLAQTDPAIGNFVAFFETSVREIRGRLDAGEAATAPCRVLMERVFDLDAMARFALGAPWERIAASQRESYRAAFGERIAADCVKRIREYRGERMTLLGVRPADGGDRLAATRFAVSGETGRILTFRLRAGGPPLRARDLIVDGSSLLLSTRDSYAAVLRSHDGDINALITFMLR
jgi:ABC-type transporter MlaC component